MRKKITAFLTCLAFVLFEAMCTHFVKQPVTQVMGPKNQGVDILKVLKKSGEVVNFTKGNPGKVQGEYVFGSRESLGEPIIIPESETKSVKSVKRGFRDTYTTEIVTTGGTTYSLNDPSVASIKREKGRFIVTPRKPGGAIHFSEIDLVWARRSDPGMTVLAVLGGIALAAGGTMLLIAALKESCPFIYSYDGQNFIFDAEPYGGATCPGLQRTEWCTLEHLREVNGEFRLKITNEVDETQHTDELKLLVVDHPQGLKVVPDETGGIHTVARPVLPSLARAGGTRDILPLVKDNDWLFWQSRVEEKDPDNPADVRDELLFEFPKPAGATRAKLVFNGCNTLWASQMVKLLLELHGANVGQCYAAMNAKGIAYQALMNWNLQEELYRLAVRVETRSGWVSKGTIVGGGPFISEDRVYPLDLGDVPGDTVRIKLLPPTGFWMVNALALDYTEDQPVQTTELAAVEAKDSSGRDVREALAQNDGAAYVMPKTGDWGTITFLSPPRLPGLDRTVIAKASGYYDIHLKAEGPTRADILRRIQTEPGFAARYALKEYLRWAKEVNQASKHE